MKPSFRLLYACVVTFLITSCTPIQAAPTVTDVEVVNVLPTRTEKPVVIPSETSTSLPIINTDAPIPTPTDTVSLIGTPLPEISTTISIENYMRLKRVGQWGRGSIQGVGFAPDGKSFVAISELGWSIYDIDRLNQPPLWVPFDEPVVFSNVYFSTDGAFVRFDPLNDQSTTIRSFPSAEVSTKVSGIRWAEPKGTAGYREVSVEAPDGTRVFKSHIAINPEDMTDEKSVREVFDANNKLLYTLRDDAPYVTYSDRNGPEGCDLAVFSPCGNALAPVPTTPIKVLFSSDGSTFAALYDPPDLYSGIMKAFSYIRIYSSANGDLLGSLGGFTKPVQDFAYSPDGKLLIAGFVDGSIVLWDIKSAKSIYGTRHMNAPVWKLVYSHDSKYLLIQRAEEIEVRLTTNGALLYRFDAAEFAVSPVRNLLALGDDEGNIQIRDIDTGQSVRGIKAHQDRIYSIAFSQDGFYLASSGRDCDIKLWDLESGKLLHHFEETAVDAYELGTPSRIFSTYLEFIPGKDMLIGFGSWGTVVNWNVNSGAANYVIQSSALEYYNGMITLKPHFPEFFDVDTTTNNFYINDNGFDLNTGKSLGVYKIPEGLPDGCSPVGPVSNDKRIMFTRGFDTREGKICVLDAESLNLLEEIYVMPENNNHIQWVDWLYLSPDGRQLIVTIGSGIVFVYQIA